jgi:transposase
MLTSVQYFQIRKCEKEGQSRRKCAEYLGISRKAVNKYWGGKNIPTKYNSNLVPKISHKTEFKETLTRYIHEFIENHKDYTTKKQKLTAKQAYDEISQKMQVGYSTIRKYFRKIMDKKPEAFLKLSFLPAQVMQVDWTQISVKMEGIKDLVTVDVFCAILCHSKAIIAIPMYDHTFKSYALAQIKAFNFFGGITSQIWFDNASTHVKKFSGENALKTTNFKNFALHYSFDPYFMNAAKGNEKGSVENLCGLLKTSICTGVPKVKNMNELAQKLETKCTIYNETHKLQTKNFSIKEMLDEEKKVLKHLPPTTYLGKEIEIRAKVDKFSLFRFDTNSYSVPVEYVAKEITIINGLYDITAYYNGEKIAQHDRYHTKNKIVVNYWHYASLLNVKPRALGNAFVVVEGDLPEPLEKFRQYLISKKRDLSELGYTITLIVSYKIKEEEVFLKAVSDALKTGKPSYTRIRNFLKTNISSNDILEMENYADQVNNLTMYDELAIHTLDED